MCGADHQRDRLGFHLTDPAMPTGLLGVGAVQQNVAEFVREGLDLRGRVHVLPHRHRLRGVIGHAVRAVDHPLVRHLPHREPGSLDLRDQALPQPGGRFAFQQPRCRWLGYRVTGGLARVPHIRRADADHLGAHHLTGTWLLALPESPPGVRLCGVGRGEPAGHRGENLVARLALLHLPSELLPLFVAGHI